MRLFNQTSLFDLFRTPHVQGAGSLGSPAYFADFASALAGTDMTLTRATTATCWGYGPTANEGDAQILLNCAVGEMRFEGARRISEGVWSDTFANGDPITTPIRLLREEQATNLVVQSNDLSVAPWTLADGAAVTHNAIVAPSSSGFADLVDISASTASRLYHSLGALTDGQIYAISFIARAVSGEGMFPVGFFSLDEYEKQYITLTESWRQYTLTVVGRTRPNHVLAFTRRGDTALETLYQAYITDVNFVVGAVATSAIPTNGTTVTRNADQFTLPSSIISDAQGTAYLEVEPHDWAQVGGQFLGDGVEAVISGSSTNFAYSQSTDGVELVVDSAFDSGIDNWTDSSSPGGSIEWNTFGALDLVYTSGTVRANYSFATEIGESYVVTIDKVGDTVSAYAPGNETLGSIVGASTFTGVFSATEASTVFSIRMFGVGTATINSVSMHKVTKASGPSGTPSGRAKMAIRWGNGKMRIAVNGVLGTEADYDGSWNLSSLLLGNGCNARFSGLKTWSTIASDAELQGLTA